jgi:hypothetical protein
MTDAEKLRNYDQVVEIIDRQFALMTHQQQEAVRLEFIEASKVFAYRKIAFLITGIDPL